MKKILAILLTLTLLCGCGVKETSETKERKIYAIIKTPKGEIIEGYADYCHEYSTGTYVVNMNGKEYHTSSINVLIIRYKG